MSDADAYEQGLWEHLDALTGTIVEKADRLLMGSEEYEHSLNVSEEVRRIEEKHMRERMRVIREISEKNRSLK